MPYQPRGRLPRRFLRTGSHALRPPHAFKLLDRCNPFASLMSYRLVRSWLWRSLWTKFARRTGKAQSRILLVNDVPEPTVDNNFTPANVGQAPEQTETLPPSPTDWENMPSSLRVNRLGNTSYHPQPPKEGLSATPSTRRRPGEACVLSSTLRFNDTPVSIPSPPDPLRPGS